MTPTDPRHGTNAGYVAGCRHDCCRQAHMVELKKWRLSGRRMVDVIGTRRRVEALERIGYSRAEQSRMLGKTREYIGHVLRNDLIHATTAAQVRDLYDRYCMEIPIDPPVRHKGANKRHQKTRRRAERLGFAPPLAWDEGTIDDPKARPHVTRKTERGVDPIVVARLLSGDWSVPSTPAEKAAAAEAWHRSGRSLNELARASGWKVERYYQTRAA